MLTLGCCIAKWIVSCLLVSSMFSQLSHLYYTQSELCECDSVAEFSSRYLYKVLSSTIDLLWFGKVFCFVSFNLVLFCLVSSFFFLVYDLQSHRSGKPFTKKKRQETREVNEKKNKKEEIEEETI